MFKPAMRGETSRSGPPRVLVVEDDPGIADAVMYALCRPPSVHVAEIVVRPNKDFAL